MDTEDTKPKTLYRIGMNGMAPKFTEIWAYTEQEAITIWIHWNAEAFKLNKNATLKVERVRVISITDVQLILPAYKMEVLR